MNTKIFFFDLDGTIVKQNGITSERVIKAIKSIREDGHLCFIASGRPLTFISDYIRDIGFDGYILCNGSVIVYHNEIIENHPLDELKVKDFINFLEKSHTEYILQTSEKCYIKRECTRMLEFYKKNKIDIKQFVYDFNRDEQINQTCKIELYPKNINDRIKIIDKLDEFSYINYDDSFIEVYSKEKSKASAVKKMIQSLNIEYKNTYCFGDGKNDIEMFKEVCHSYAMENAKNEVKKEAKYVCSSVDEDGTAIILEQLILSRK